MANHSKGKLTTFLEAIPVLLLSAVTMIMLSGCGNSEKDTISGRITLGGAAFPGVTLTLSGDTSRTTVTDVNGNYSFINVPSGTFTLTPSFTGLTFSPTKRKVFLQGQDAIGFNFSGSGQGRIVTTTHTVYLNKDGIVLAWGNNSDGQLGDGSTTQSTTPVQVTGLIGVFTAIAAGDAHTIALKDDGTVWAWGSNSNGQLGLGDDSKITQSSTPVQVTGLTGIFTAIAAGDNHNVALKNDGTIWAWGSNSNGQLGDGSTTQSTTPVKVSGLSGVTAIAAGGNHNVALKDDDTVWAWGSNTDGQLGNGNTTQKTTPVQVAGLSGVIAISAGNAHSVALKGDGAVWAWGSNTDGQLGNGNTTRKTTPVQVKKLSSVIGISAGTDHTIAVKDDGTVWTWGSNSKGQLGLGDDSKITQSTTPVQVTALSGMIAVAAGNADTLALKAAIAGNADNTLALSVWAWGNNSNGQLGDGTVTDEKKPVNVLLP